MTEAAHVLSAERKFRQDLLRKWAVEGLMCRTLLSVSWDGSLYDCDFNLATGRFSADHKIHVSDIRELLLPSPFCRPYWRLPSNISPTLSPACAIDQVIFAISQDRSACAT